MLRECFVAQCFDDGLYDRRYRETFAPAIQEAGATPVRADESLGTTPIIEKIEANLRRSSIAFAEISEDNPNVFLELGMALSLKIPTIIVCDRSKRAHIPFDIQHRPVIFYSTNAQSDFEKLKRDIEQNARAALLDANQRITSHDTIIAFDEEKSMDGVKQRCLVELLDQDLRSPSGATLWELQQALVGSEMSNRMVTLAIAGLISDQYVERLTDTDQNGEPYSSVRLSEFGRNHVMREYAALMKAEKERLRAHRQRGFAEDHEVPF